MEENLIVMVRILISVLAFLSLPAMALPVSGASAAGRVSVGAAVVAEKPAGKSAEGLFSVSMHCRNCVEKITGNISFEKGVKDLKVSLDKHTVWIKYDPSRTDEARLKAAIEKLGYDVRKTEDE